MTHEEGHEDRRRNVRRTTVGLALAAAALLPGCERQPDCSGGLQPYKGRCLSNTAIEYVGCTEGRGISPTTEIGAGVKGTFKVVADASLDLAYEKSEAENTPVALQIVQDCLAIAKQTASAAELAAVDASDERVDDFLERFREEQVADEPTLALSTDSAAIGETVTVTGTNFTPDETVEIHLHASLVGQVKADATGSFSTDVVVPQNAPPPDFSTSIRATGLSSGKSMQRPFHT